MRNYIELKSSTDAKERSAFNTMDNSQDTDNGNEYHRRQYIKSPSQQKLDFSPMTLDNFKV